MWLLRPVEGRARKGAGEEQSERHTGNDVVWSPGARERREFQEVSGTYTSHFQLGSRAVRPSWGLGAEVRSQPRHLRLLVQPGVSYLVSSPLLGEQERK